MDRDIAIIKKKNLRTFEISVFNTLGADDECSRHNRENLPLPIQIQ